MSRVTINVKSYGKPGETESHFGYVCTVGPEGQLFADVPAEMLQNELDNHRVTLIPVDPGAGAEARTKDELKAMLDTAGIPYLAAMNKDELKALLANKGA